MGKLTISMAIFNSYVKLPEGSWFTQLYNGGSFHSYGMLWDSLPEANLIWCNDCWKAKEWCEHMAFGIISI